MICARCHCENPANSKFCKDCGHLMSDSEQGTDAFSSSQPQTGQAAQTQMPTYTVNSGTAYQPYTVPKPTPFDWRDVSGITSFVFSLVGWFWMTVILLPLGLAGALLGIYSKNTRSLSIAGIIISVLGIVIKLLRLLIENNLLPYWITSGIFS